MTLFKTAVLAYLIHFAASFAFAGTITYTYDELGRLIKADYGVGLSIEYTYDSSGNITNITSKAPEPVVYVSPDGLCGGKPRCYTTVQQGIDATLNGETIKIAAGTYRENVVMHHNKSISVECGYNSAFTEANSSSLILSFEHRLGTITYSNGKLEFKGQ